MFCNDDTHPLNPPPQRRGKICHCERICQIRVAIQDKSIIAILLKSRKIVAIYNQKTTKSVIWQSIIKKITNFCKNISLIKNHNQH
ncbi:hypothetical protein [Helicobacter sp. T3_23-1059]